MSRAWRAGSTRTHRRARHALLEHNRRANGGRCTVALDGTRACPVHPGKRCDVCTVTATQAHHVYGYAVTGDDPEHMTPSCGPCNGHLGDPMSGDPAPSPKTNWRSVAG